MFNYTFKKVNEFNREETHLLIGKVLAHAVVVIIALVLLFGSMGMIGAGERGVHTRFKAVTGEIKQEGLYFKLPIIDRVVKMDTKVQKEETDAAAASKDLQTVTSKIAVNYSVDPNMVANIYKTVGLEYKIRLLDPAIQEVVKSATANFTAEALITHREEVKDQIKAKLQERLAGTGITIEQISIVNFDFSPSFNQAIEAKVTAEQNALAAKNKLEQVKYEAEQAIEQAKGKAEALEIEGRAITENPQVLQGRAIEKWNGILPQVTGSNIPFINIK